MTGLRTRTETARGPGASRDRRRVEHAAPPGPAHADGLGWRPRVVVAGGGIAGLTAAIALAERGVDVELCEREEHLGGRAGGWTAALPDGTPVGMSRGFHAFFRQYYNLRALLRRADPGLDRLVPVADYPLVDATATPTRSAACRVPRRGTPSPSPSAARHSPRGTCCG